MTTTTLRSLLAAGMLPALLALSAAAQEYRVDVFARGLSSPTGIAVAPDGTVYLTEVPTPGVGGDANRVARFDANGGLTTISAGEPEPVNVAANDTGNVYWTCHTAGVIVRKDPGGSVRVWRRNLMAPTGISAPAGSPLVHYTQIPTSGVPGSRGGSNSVDFVHSRTGSTTTLSSGEPEPVDVAVTPDGSRVYWTCRTAGVVVMAQRPGPRPRIQAPAGTAPGTSTVFALRAPGEGLRPYFAASSLGRGPIVLGDRYLALAHDGLFSATLAQPVTPIVSGYAGLLDINGTAAAALAVPPIPALSGLQVFTAFGVLDTAAPMGIGALSETHVLRVE